MKRETEFDVTINQPAATLREAAPGTRAWVAEHMEKRLWPKLVALRKAGQQEYAGGERAFGNFERLAARTGAARETVLWIYLTKHLDGVEAWLKGHKSQREPVQGRIEDAIVYLILLHAMAEEELQAALPVAQPATLPADGEEA